MKLEMSGIHMTIGDSLKAHTKLKMEDLKKYFDQIIDVDVSFRKERHLELAEVTIYASGINLRAVGEGADYFHAVDDAQGKLEKQLQKYKGRLTKHRKRRQKASARLEEFKPMQAAYSTLNDDSLDDAPEDMFAEFAPKVVHKNVANIEPLTVDEAVMQMDLLHKPAFLFRNAKSGRLNMVYRDTAGTVGWVEPLEG